MVRILIREGQHYDEQTQSFKNTPMHIAARHGHFLIVKYLLEIGANPVITNKDGLTPYDFADEAKRSLEISLANSKNKIGGPGIDLKKAAANLDNLHAIMRIIHRD